MENPSSSPSYFHSSGVDRGAKRRLQCESCGAFEFDDGDDGFFYCITCGSQSQDVIDTAFAEEDIHGGAAHGSGALYSIFHHRAKPQSQTPAAPPPSLISKDQLLRGLSQSIAAGGVKKEEREEGKERPYAFEDEPSEPRDFGVGVCPDAETMASGIRVRYLQGLQVMLQLQCEALVGKFGVSPLICGLAGSIWLRYVAASKVLDEGWAQKVIAESEAVAAAQSKNQGKEEEKSSKTIRWKYRWEPHNKYGQRAIYIWFRALRKTIPVYSSLAISFLVCHIAREAILPTDFYDWASEGKLPFLTAFADVEKYIGSPSVSCPLSSRFLFRPIRVIGAWQLEAAAGTIARTIGLRLPSVNFYAIASRYLRDLSLPLDKILPHACRIYEWSIPAELWLSSNASRLPTRVCVMSILIVTIRILYNLHGQGIWEKTLSDFGDSTSNDLGVHPISDCPNLSPGRKSSEYEDAKVCLGTNDSLGLKNMLHTAEIEFDAKELLHILEAKYPTISTLHDYSSDLRSYLIYCKDVLFAGMTTSYDEEILVERLWDIYNKEEDNNLQEGAKNESYDLTGKSCRDRVPTTTFIHSTKSQEESKSNQQKKRRMLSDEPITATKTAALEEMKQNMEEDGFQYLRPRVRKKADLYLHYKRKIIDGKLNYVAHADYYILLRTCARIAKVDIRIMHLGVLKLERRLSWIEQRIDNSLYTLSEISSECHEEG